MAYALEDISLFSCCDHKERELLMEIAIRRTYPPNRVLISDGDKTSSLYVVLEGKTQAVSISPDGKRIVLNTFNPGEYFGEMSFIDGCPRCGTVETKTPTQVLIIPGGEFRDLVLKNPDLCFNLMKGLLEKLRSATKQIEALVFNDVSQRVARLFISNSITVNQKVIVEPKWTQQDIAEIVGSSREMVSRVLKDLVRGKYISKEKGKIIINKELPYSW